MPGTDVTEFEKYKIKEYVFWDLYLNDRQASFIGRCYASARRENANFLADMMPEERNELFDVVVPAWEMAVKKAFNHDRSNLAILGNTWNHLHAHLIPRYFALRVFDSFTFTDPNPTGNYAPYDKTKLPLETLLKIKEAIKEKL